MLAVRVARDFFHRGKETVPGSGVSQDEKNSCMMKIG